MNIPNTLYHYTSVESAFYILGGENPASNNRFIRLSGSESLNDSKEFKLFEEHLNTLEQTEFNDEKYNKSIEELRFLLSYSESNAIFHITSFSKNSDSLSQWRAYAENGAGVALGFNKDLLLRDETSACSTEDENGVFIQDDGVISFGLIECIYDPNKQIEIVRDCINQINKALEGNYYNDEKEHRLIFEDFAQAYCQFKPEAFKEEEEVRLVRSYLRPRANKQKLNPTESLVSCRIKFKVARSAITSFSELALSCDTISSINLGPKCAISSDSQDLALFLIKERQNPRNITINKSAASYR